MWKILDGQVSDPTPNTLQSSTTGGKEEQCKRRNLLTKTPGRTRILLAAGLTCERPRIFDVLPKEVRDISGCLVEKFKAGLDKFLWTVPHEPPVLEYIFECCASNALPDQVVLMERGARIGSSGGPPQV